MLKLKALRLQSQKTQQEVANELGISRPTYSRYESGDREPDYNTLVKIADYFNVSIDDLLLRTKKQQGVKIPVLGKVAAGVPLNAIEEIIDYEEIPLEMLSQGEFFALKIHGDSMEPKISHGDVVIVRKQSDVDSGDIAIVLQNGENATCKKIIKQLNGITLMPTNHMYTPAFFTNEEVLTIPIVILGKVVELRAKFE